MVSSEEEVVEIGVEFALLQQWVQLRRDGTAPVHVVRSTRHPEETDERLLDGGALEHILPDAASDDYASVYEPMAPSSFKRSAKPSRTSRPNSHSSSPGARYQEPVLWCMRNPPVRA